MKPQVVVAGFRLVVLAPEGSLWWWGQGDLTLVRGAPPWRLGKDADWAAIAAGWAHVVALKTNGTLWQWAEGTRLGASAPTQVRCHQTLTGNPSPSAPCIQSP